MKDPILYQIRVQGHLDPAWLEWFEGLTLTHDEKDNTVLAGQIVDQAALHGVLNKIFALGLTLMTVDQTGGECNQLNRTNGAATPRLVR